MSRRLSPRGRARLAHALALVAPVLLPALPLGAGAAELTDVIDADDGPDDLWDFRGEVTYRRSLHRAKVTREYNCHPGIRDVDADTCPAAASDGPGELVHVKELRYERTTHEIVPRARFGLWHDLELAIEAPIVVSDSQSIRFAGNGGDRNAAVITPENSSIAPGERNGIDEENLFEVPTEGLPTRAGFGDMLFMVRWSPVARERDDMRGDWTVEVGYRAPTGEAMAFGNEGVGRGTHELILATALSRRFKYSEPYSRLEVTFPFAADDSLFQDYGFAQEHVAPGTRARFDFGSEFIPFEMPDLGVRIYLDLGLGGTYQAEGRDYTELFDALASGSADPSGRTCDPNGAGGSTNCASYNPDSGSTAAAARTFDGITTVEQFMTVRAHAGFGVYVSKYAKLGADLMVSHDTEHFVSKADIGRDKDGSGLVEAKGDPKYNAAEHNPTYSPAIDAVGRRLRIEEATNFQAAFNLSVLF